jgi:hypothetical protein
MNRSTLFFSVVCPEMRPSPGPRFAPPQTHHPKTNVRLKLKWVRPHSA